MEGGGEAATHMIIVKIVITNLCLFCFGLVFQSLSAFLCVWNCSRKTCLRCAAPDWIPVPAGRGGGGDILK